jgi:hypothetical protein
METPYSFSPAFCGTHVKIDVGVDTRARVTLLVNSLTREMRAYVSVIFGDEVEILLDADWGMLLESDAPVTVLAGSRQVTFDADALDVLEAVGWDLLIEQGHFPTVWRGEWPRSPSGASTVSKA